MRKLKFECIICNLYLHYIRKNYFNDMSRIRTEDKLKYFRIRIYAPTYGLSKGIKIILKRTLHSFQQY